MLSLEDERWGELQQAYGSAANVPELLRQLRSSPGPTGSYQEEPWYSLWSSLCHQGDVYTASYAAVPHIVKIGCETRSPIAFSFLQLPSAIEVARRNGRGPELPVELSQEYHRALTSLAEVVCLHRNEPWDQPMLLSAMAAQAVAKGHIEVAEAILNLDGDLISKINRFELN